MLTYRFSTKILYNNVHAAPAICFALLFYKFESIASLNYSTSSCLYTKKESFCSHLCRRNPQPGLASTWEWKRKLAK